MIRRLLLMFCLLAFPSAALSQSRPDDPIRELLSEVRLLREALDRAATTGTRIQLLVARVQLQEQRMAELSRRLDGVRSELRDIDRGTSQIGEQIESLEEAATQTTDVLEQKAIEQRVASVKAQLARTERRRQELANDEAFLSQQLSSEQNRWADFNERLEQLERSLVVREKRP